MKNTNHTPIGMLVTIGGASTPVVYVLNEKRPKYICFFVSAQSRASVIQDILPQLNEQPEDIDFIQTASPQNLLACYQSLLENLENILNRWNIQPGELVVDYTAGTKPMSVAAVLVTIEASSQYCYIGSAGPEGRDRDGVGVVINGNEHTWFESNPWEALAVVERKQISLLFNLGRFAEAKERTLHLAELVEPEMQKVYRAIAGMIEGYEHWDRFDYRRANDQFNRAVSDLKLFVAGRQDPLRNCLEAVSRHIAYLVKFNKKNMDAEAIREFHRVDVLDLIANAERRAQLERKFDDAAARLYSAMECLARYRLQDEYDTRNHDVRPDQLPEPIRDEYISRYGSSSDAITTMKLGLQASYRLLAALEDDLGLLYIAREKEVDDLLYTRNQSRLAHGNVPVKESTYSKMREIVFDFARINEDELPGFPKLVL